MNYQDRSTSQGAVDHAVAIRRAVPEERRAALTMLLTGRPRTLMDAVDGFFELAEQQKLSLEELWAAYRHGEVKGAVLIIPGAGRAATCLVCPVLEHASVAVASRLIDTACSSQDNEKIHFIQAMADPCSHLEIESLKTAGFQEVACLRYMENRNFSTKVLKEWDNSIQVRTWNQQRHAMFAQAILESYEDTMDCPMLLGLREIDDIIASHMATGVFSPDLWFCLVVDDQPIAVMLMNRIPQQRAMELVYLGVRKDWRCRGIGKQLVQFGLEQCRRGRVTSMVLAVDESNHPAKTLYQRLGFTAGARKLALIFTLT